MSGHLGEGGLELQGLHTCGELGGDGGALPGAFLGEDPQCVLCGRFEARQRILHRVPGYRVYNFRPWTWSKVRLLPLPV